MVISVFKSGLEIFVKISKCFEVYLMCSSFFVLRILNFRRTNFAIAFVSRKYSRIVSFGVRMTRISHLEVLKKMKKPSSGTNRTIGVPSGLPVVFLSNGRLTGA